MQVIDEHRCRSDLPDGFRGQSSDKRRFVPKSARRPILTSHEPQTHQLLCAVADVIVASGVGLVIFVLYLCTLAPTVIAADAGELVTAAYELGIAHPPGYPLWCLAAHTFVVLFNGIEDVAYRVNLFSAVCGSLSCVMVYIVARRMDLARLASAAGALMLGASRELWAQSVIAEVYTLNAFIFMVCLLCLVEWNRSRHPRWLMAFSFALGLGMTDHHTIGIIGPAAVVLVLWCNWRTILKWKLVLLCIALFILPLGIYLYLPLRAATCPYMDWGHPETISRLWSHVMRAQYRINAEPVERSAVRLFFQFTMVLRNYLDQFSPVVGLFALVAVPVVLIYRRDGRWLAMALLVVWIFGFYEWVLNTRLERQSVEADRVFFIPAYACAALLIAAVLDSWVRRLTDAFTRRLPLGPAYAACALLLLLPFAAALAHNFTANNFSTYWYAEDHSFNMFASMEKDAVIFPSGDHNTFPLIHFHCVKGMRPDITIADKYGYVESRDFPQLRTVSEDKTRIPRDQVLNYLLTQTDRPVYFTVKWNVPPGLTVQQVQAGLLYRVSRNPPKDDPHTLWSRYAYRNAENGFENPPDYGAINIVSDYFFFRAVDLMQSSKADEALALFARSSQLATGVKEVDNNIGSALAENGLLDAAQRYYRQALRLDDRYVSALWNLARTCSALGDRAAAADYFKKLAHVTPDDFRVPGELGFLYLRHLGNTELAQKYLEDSLKLNPNQPQIQDELKQLAQAMSAQQAHQGLKADRSVHDFGKVLINTKANTTFSLTNTSDIPIDTTDVRSDCSCTVPQIASRHLEPGQTVRLDATYQEPEHFGPQSKRITVKTSVGQELALTIQADIVPLFSTTPTTLEIDEAFPAISQTRTITVSAYDKRPFAIASIESTLDEIQPVLADDFKNVNTQHEITVQINPAATLGKRQGQIQLHIADADQSTVQLPVSLEVRHPVKVSPRSIFLNSLSRKNPKTVSIELDLPSGWVAGVTHIICSADWLKVTYPPKSLEEHTVITCQIDAERIPTSFSGTVSICTDHPSISTIIVPVYGFTE